MTKRGLLIGCNYPGSNAELKGCINDVWGMKEILIEYYGFEESDITVLIDTDDTYEQPSGRNMKKAMKQLVSESEDGDVLFIHFSGHGTQVPSQDGDEADRKDEALVPTDMNLITDDDLRAIFGPLPDGVKFTFVADCCHSGSMLDHQQVAIEGDKSGEGGGSEQVVGGLLQSLGLKEIPEGGFRPEEGANASNRSLSPDMLINMLSGSTGQDVQQGNIYSTLTSVFGDDSSLKAGNYMQVAQMALGAVTGQEGGGMIGGILGMCCGAATSADEGLAEPEFDSAQHVPEAQSVPLGEDKGVLITGCGDDETSADASASDDPKKAFGALSNALQNAIKAHFANNPDEPLTNRTLVATARAALAKTGFSQNPQLECSEGNADGVFIA